MRGPALALLLLAAPARANTRAGTEVRPSGPSSVPGAAADPLRASPLDLPLLPSDVLSTPLPPQTAAPLALPPAEVPAAMGAAPAQERRDEAPLAPARAQLEAAMDGADEAGSADSTEGSAAGAGASFDGLLRAASEDEGSFPYLSRLDPAAGTIDGIPAERISNIGADNAGIYALSRGGSPRILKILLYGPASYGVQGARAQLRGARLGQLFGGPVVRRAGVIEGADGSRQFFIEMDELFPGRLSYSLKELFTLADHEGDKENYAMVVGRPAARMGVMLARVLEEGVIPRDPDFLISEDGQVAWLDANQWRGPRPLSDPEQTRQAGHQVRIVARRLAAGSGPAVRTFLESFFRALKASPRLTEQTRRALLRQAFLGDAARGGEETVNGIAAQVAREAGLPGEPPFQAILAFYESLN